MLCIPLYLVTQLLWMEHPLPLADRCRERALLSLTIKRCRETFSLMSKKSDFQIFLVILTLPYISDGLPSHGHKGHPSHLVQQHAMASTTSHKHLAALVSATLSPYLQSLWGFAPFGSKDQNVEQNRFAGCDCRTAPGMGIMVGREQ